MKGKNQVSKEEMSTVIGKWFTMTSKDEDGNMYQHVIYCKEVLENGEVLFAPVNPDPSLDWDKLSKVDMVHYDMAPINNFIYRYFNTLLNKVTLTDINCMNKQQANRYMQILYRMSEKHNRDFDELFLERRGDTFWVHFAVRPTGNRRKIRYMLG